MEREGQVRHQMAEGSKQRHASLAKMHVHEVVDGGCDGVSHKRRKEDEGDNGVVHIVVGFELSVVSHIRSSKGRGGAGGCNYERNQSLSIFRLAGGLT